MKKQITQIKLILDLNTQDLEKADELVRKMLTALGEEELDIIGNANLTQTVSDIEMSSADFKAIKETKDDGR